VTSDFSVPSYLLEECSGRGARNALSGLCVCDAGFSGDACSGCDAATCSNHGVCRDAKCACYDGYSGEFCASSAVQEYKQAGRGAVVDLSWGLLGVDMDGISALHPNGRPRYDPAFDPTSPAAQLSMLRTVQLAANATAAAGSMMRVRPTAMSVTSPVLSLHHELVSRLGFGLPIPAQNFSQGIMGLLRATGGGDIRKSPFREYVGFASAGGGAVHLLWLRARVETTIKSNIGAEAAVAHEEAWATFVEGRNGDALTPAGVARGVQSCFVWVRMRTELSVVTSTIQSWALSNGFAFGAVLIFTRNLRAALLATACVFGIILTLLCVMCNVLGWPLGAVEAISVTIFVGLAVDYVLHVVHAYAHAPFADRAQKVEHALAHIAPSICSSAVTTFGSSVFLFGCTLQVRAPCTARFAIRARWSTDVVVVAIERIGLRRRWAVQRARVGMLTLCFPFFRSRAFCVVCFVFFLSCVVYVRAQVLVQLGAVVALNTVLSVTFALIVMPAALSLLGATRVETGERVVGDGATSLMANEGGVEMVAVGGWVADSRPQRRPSSSAWRAPTGRGGVVLPMAMATGSLVPEGDAVHHLPVAAAVVMPMAVATAAHQHGAGAGAGAGGGGGAGGGAGPGKLADDGISPQEMMQQQELKRQQKLERERQRAAAAATAPHRNSTVICARCGEPSTGTNFCGTCGAAMGLDAEGEAL
jgi:hypothetical protein